MDSDNRNTHLGPLMIDLKGTGMDAEERSWLQAPAVGGVILFTRNFRDLDQLGELVAEIHAARNPPLLVAVDHEGGRVQRFRGPFTELPPMRALGRLHDRNPGEALAASRAFGWLMAAELRALGIDLSFAPVVDLDLGMAEVIGDRALHFDAAVVGALCAEFSSGANAAGMPPVQPEEVGIPPNWSPYFAVADCDETVAKAESLGGKLDFPPMEVPEVGRFTFLQDPQGAHFAIIQFAPSS